MHARTLIVLVTSTSLAIAAGAYARAPHAATAPRIDHSSSPASAVQHGRISWYGGSFAGRRTASGERYDPHAMTMAHRSLPLGTIVLVTNDDNGRRATLVVNDRGPYARGRVADVSRAASLRLGFSGAGIADATLQVLWIPATAFGDSGEPRQS